MTDVSPTAGRYVGLSVSTVLMLGVCGYLVVISPALMVLGGMCVNTPPDSDCGESATVAVYVEAASVFVGLGLAVFGGVRAIRRGQPMWPWLCWSWAVPVVVILFALMTGGDS